MNLDQHLVAYSAAWAAGDEAEADRIAAIVQAEDDALEARLNAPDALHAAARWYASAGVHVFPLRPGDKVPATRNGFKDATTDLAQVDLWWTRNPTYNIGLPTGLTFDVLDIDGPPGYASIARLGVPEGFLAVAATPRGRHYYYPPVEGRGNKTAIADGIDYRGLGGYVVAVPSRRAEGKYRWVTPPAFMGAK